MANRHARRSLVPTLEALETRQTPSVGSAGPAPSVLADSFGTSGEAALPPGGSAWDAAAGPADISIAAAAGTGASIPRHYKHIRIAELAYSGLPIGFFEDKLLRSSVDLVVSDMDSLSDHIFGVAPSTPQLAYANTSSLYLGLLTDWLTYADQQGAARKRAFYHVARATPFSGDSPSSQPVNWFWGVYLSGDSADFTDLTAAAHDRSRRVTFGSQGESVYLGYPEKFRAINLNLARGARAGWSAVLEYPTAVDAYGNPTAWAPLRTLSDTTRGLTRSGRIVFDPPANWKTSVAGSPARLYYVRVRTVNDGSAPQANTILGRDYVNARGGTRGVIPAFDYAADKNHDGYLDDAEYAHRARGKDARFAYESRVFYGFYGQQRFATNPSDPAFRAWAVDYSLRYLRAHSLAKGLFMDNSGGNAFLSPGDVIESVATYARDYGALLRAIGRAIAPRWVLANTAGGGGASADGVVRQITGYFEEFALRPLAQNYQQFEDLAASVAHREALRSRAPYAVLDSLPTGGSPTDPRTQLATLAEYYLLADPKTTFIDFFGGYEPGTSWTRHWVPAAAYDIGQPRGEWSLFATGRDPANRALTYRVYQRSYTNALVLYKPLSYGPGARASGGLGGRTTTTLPLGGTYRPLRADGSLGAPVRSITLHNGEGAILVKV